MTALPDTMASHISRDIIASHFPSLDKRIAAMVVYQDYLSVLLAKGLADGLAMGPESENYRRAEAIAFSRAISSVSKF